MAGGELVSYPDGVLFVDLAPLQHAALVPHVVATVFGLRDEPHEPVLETLARHLEKLHLLLLIDNCEHVLGATVEVLHALLRGCPHVHILATSREVLGIPAKSFGTYRRCRFPTLRSRDGWYIARLGSGAAVLGGARAASRTFVMSDANAPVIAEICERLEGIPLALEIAAARAAGDACGGPGATTQGSLRRAYDAAEAVSRRQAAPVAGNGEVLGLLVESRNTSPAASPTKPAHRVLGNGGRLRRPQA